MYYGHRRRRIKFGRRDNQVLSYQFSEGTRNIYKPRSKGQFIWTLCSIARITSYHLILAVLLRRSLLPLSHFVAPLWRIQLKSLTCGQAHANHLENQINTSTSDLPGATKEKAIFAGLNYLSNNFHASSAGGRGADLKGAGIISPARYQTSDTILILFIALEIPPCCLYNSCLKQGNVTSTDYSRWLFSTMSV